MAPEPKGREMPEVRETSFEGTKTNRVEQMDSGGVNEFLSGGQDFFHQFR